MKLPASNIQCHRVNSSIEEGGMGHRRVRSAKVFSAGKQLTSVPPCPPSEENVMICVKGLDSSTLTASTINGPHGFSLWLLPFSACSFSQHTFLLCPIFQVSILTWALPSQLHPESFHGKSVESLTLLYSASTCRVFRGSLLHTL